MSGLAGKIGVNIRHIDQDVFLQGKATDKTFNNKQEALDSAIHIPGSQLVFENDGKWEVANIKEKGWATDNMYDLNSIDQSLIELDNSVLSAKGITAVSSQISFADDDYVDPLMTLATTGATSVKMELARRTDLPDAVINELAKLGNTSVKMVLVNNQSTPINTLRDLAKTGSQSVKQSLARNERARNDQQIEQTLIKTGNSYTKQLMAMPVSEINQRFNPEVSFGELNYNNPAIQSFIQLANDPYSSVRETVASRFDLPNEAYLILANDAYSSVRETLAENIYASPQALFTMADDPYSSVRENVAANPHAPIEALRILANDAYSSVREIVAKHPAAHHDPFIAHSLANDPYSSVREAFAQGPRFRVIDFPRNPALIYNPEISTKPSQEINIQQNNIHVGDNITINNN